MPGPRPTPTYLKLLRGNPGKRKLNKREPQPQIRPRRRRVPNFWTAMRGKSGSG